MANRGTIFLDEVGEMSLRMQALLLRFLETGEIQRVGADRQVSRVDVRVICATHRDLRQRVREGTFREDLFYRLNVVHIHIPPLRERREDVRDLLQHFLAHFAEHHGVTVPVPTPEGLALLLGYDWPGNVRELRNVLERVVLRRSDVVTPDDLPRELQARADRPRRRPRDGPIEETRAALTRRLMGRMLVRGESFWDVVYAPFLAHDLTRQQLRDVIQAGLDQCQGRYNALTELFNMPKRDYRRFLGALKKFDCLVAAPVGPEPERDDDAATAERAARAADASAEARPEVGADGRHVSSAACRFRWCRWSRARPGSSSRASARRRSAGSTRRRRRTARPSRARRSPPPPSAVSRPARCG